MAIETSDGSCLIRVHVRPGSSKQQIIIKENPIEVEIRLKQRAEKEKANKELIKLFRKIFRGCSVFLVAGAKSRLKTLEIRGVDAEIARSKLKRIASENQGNDR